MKTIIRTMMPLLLLAALAVTGCGQQKQASEGARLLQDARQAYTEGDYARSGDLYAQAMEKGVTNPNTAYNAACSYALAERPNEALNYLSKATELGYRNVEWMTSDSDLASLRDMERWDEIVSRARSNEEQYKQTVNAELYEIYQADQAARQNLDFQSFSQQDWQTFARNDSARLARVKEILDGGELDTADDYYHAAMVLQHGGEPDDYQLAHKLASKAAKMDPDHPTAAWLAAAAKDRYLHSIGEPQIYGTQTRIVHDMYTVEPFDTTQISDAERAELGILPAAKIIQRVKKMNAAARSASGDGEK